MIKLLVLVGFLLCAMPSWGAIALVNVAGGHDSTGASDATIATNSFSLTAANLLVCGVRGGSTTIPTLSDTAGNTFTSIAAASDAGGDTVRLFYAKNVTGNAADVVTASFSPATTFAGIICHQYSGADTAAPLDVSATGTNAAGTSVTSGSFTPTNASDVAVAMASIGALGSTFTAGAGYTKQRTEDFFQSEDKLNAGTAAQTAAMSSTGSADWQLVVATFKPAAGGTPVKLQCLTSTGVGQ